MQPPTFTIIDKKNGGKRPRSTRSSRSKRRKLLEANAAIGLLSGKSKKSTKTNIPESVPLNASAAAIQVKQEETCKKAAPPKLDKDKDYFTDSITKFSKVFKVLQTIGFWWNGVGKYKHPDINGDFGDVLDLRAYLCRYGIPNIDLVQDPDEREMVEQFVCFAHVDQMALSNAQMGLLGLSHEILPSAKIIPLLCRVFGFQMTPGGVFWAPGANYIPREEWKEHVHYFNKLEDVRVYVRCHELLEVERNGRVTTRRSHAQVTDHDKLSLRLWAAVSKEPLPTFIRRRRPDVTRPSVVASNRQASATSKSSKTTARKKPPPNLFTSPFPDHVTSRLLCANNNGVPDGKTNAYNDNNPFADADSATKASRTRGRSKYAGSAVLEVEAIVLDDDSTGNDKQKNTPESKKPNISSEEHTHMEIEEYRQGMINASQSPIDSQKSPSKREAKDPPERRLKKKGKPVSKKTTNGADLLVTQAQVGAVGGNGEKSNEGSSVNRPEQDSSNHSDQQTQDESPPGIKEEMSLNTLDFQQPQPKTPEQMYSALAKDIQVHRRLRDHLRKAVGLMPPGRQEHAISTTVPADLKNNALPEENKRLARIREGVRFEIKELEKM